MTIKPKESVLVIPDTHAPFQHPDAYNFLEALADKYQPTRIVHLGDEADFHAISRFPSDPDGMSAGDEYEAMLEQMEPLYDMFPDVQVCVSNHCLMPTAKAFVNGEWKEYKDIKEGDVAIGIDLSTGKLVRQRVNKVVEFDYTGTMHRVKTANYLSEHTPNHRILHGVKNREWRFNTAEGLDNGMNTRIYIPTGGQLAAPGVEQPNYNVALAGWLLTDCYYPERGNRVIFSQAEAKLHIITDLLTDGGYAFTVTEDTHVVTEICGKELKSTQSRYFVTVKGEDGVRLRSLVPDRHKLPTWAYDMNGEQVRIFLNALLQADGTHDRILYCSRKELREGIQALLHMHGFRTVPNEYRPGHWRLSISENSDISLDGGYSQRLEKFEYSGKIWCLEVDHGNFMVEQGGFVSITGNTARPFRKAYDAGMPAALLKSYREFMQAPEGWSWHESIEIDGVKYEHGEGFTGAYAATKIATANMQSTVHGHVHSSAGIHWIANPKHLIFGFNVGCLIDTDAYAFAYGKRIKNKPILGAGIVHKGLPTFVPMLCDARGKWTKKL